MFRVGMRVVCVDGDFLLPRQKGQENYPSQDGIYTIRALRYEEFLALGRYTGPQPAALLVEVVNYPLGWAAGFMEAGFALRRFRPVVERKTSIAVFTEMLGPKQLERV